MTSQVTVVEGEAAQVGDHWLAEQVRVARQNPRVISDFIDTCITIATGTRAIAESCFYHLPIGKGIDGPSVRLAATAGSSSTSSIFPPKFKLSYSESNVPANPSIGPFPNNCYVRSLSRLLTI